MYYICITKTIKTFNIMKFFCFIVFAFFAYLTFVKVKKTWRKPEASLDDYSETVALLVADFIMLLLIII